MKAVSLWALFLGALLALVLTLGVVGCGDDDDDDDGVTGTLTFLANGEEFIRDGFIGKTGWDISFDHFHVTVSGLTGIQVAEEESETTALTTAHAGHPHNDIPEGSAYEALMGAYALDLATGDGPQVVDSLEVPIGNYNYVSWNVIQAAEGEFAGYSIVMIGTAAKDGETIAFTIKLDAQYTFSNCHQEVDDDYAGVVDEGGEGSIETTYHSDHLFGDFDDLGNPDGVNPIALGFQAFADLAVDGVLDIDQAQMQEQMTPDDYATFVAALDTLGHSGEGHCNCGDYQAE